MHNVLSQLLERRGIKDTTELTEEERQDFANWQQILGEEDVSIKGLLGFIESEIAHTQSEFKDLDRTTEKTERIGMKLGIFITIRDLINSKEKEREGLIERLTNL